MQGSQITDACLPDLQRMYGLRAFGFQETAFTQEAFRQLKQALPQCVSIERLPPNASNATE